MRGDNRRNHQRVDLGATATLLQHDDMVGRFTVQNLSAGGALLTGAHGVEPEAPLQVLLELPNGDFLAIGAAVRRRADVGSLVALAVAFEHITADSEDRIQESLLAHLDRRYREEHPAILIVDADPSARRTVIDRLADTRHRTIPCPAPLDAMRVLEIGDEFVEAVVVRDGLDGSHPELLTWVVENHPQVRPILLVEDRGSDPHVSRLEVARCFPEQLAEVLA